MPKAEIMVVEDEILVSKDIRSQIEHLGYSIAGWATTGDAAIRVASEKKPDLILMDIALRGEMDGIRAAEWIRENLHIPVIYLTAHGDPQTVGKAKSTAPLGFLLKPISENELRISIEMALYKAEMDKKLLEAEERFRTVADFTYDWETWTGPDGRYLYVSPSCERITGYTRDEFMAAPSLMLQIIHPEDDSGLRGHFLPPITDIPEFRADFRIYTKTGDICWISHHCQVVTGKNGVFLGRRGSNRDITARKELESRVARNLKIQSLGTVAGGVAHQYNNLLMGILGNAELAISDLPSDAAIQNYLEQIRQIGLRAAKLTKQILAYTGAGMKESVRLTDLTETAGSAADVIVASSAGTVALIKEFDADLPAIQADSSLIAQMVMNLVENALEALPETGGVIHLKVDRQECTRDFLKQTYVDDSLPDGAYVCIAVRDNGHGIPPEILDRIFDPFFSTRFTGRGLGLAAVLGIARSHRGAVLATSEPGKGTEFRVYLPVETDPAAGLDIGRLVLD